MRKSFTSASLQSVLSQSLALLVVSLFLGVAVGCHRDPNVQKQKYLESGKRYVNEGKYKEAAIQFANALKVDHNFADAHFEMAKMYIKTNAMQRAYIELLRVVELQPNNIQARIDLGNLLLAGAAQDRATEQANAVLALQSNNADAHALLSSIAASKGDRATATSEIQKAIELDPNKSNFHAAYGVLQSSDPASASTAEQQLRKAVDLDPKNVQARIVLANLLEKKGDIPDAVEQMKAAVATDPNNIVARGGLAGLYLRSGDKAKAEDSLHQTADDLNDNKDAVALLRTFYAQTNQLDRAEPAYASLLAKHPKSTPIKLVYARILLSKPDPAKGKQLLADLVKADPNDPDVAILNGTVLLTDGKTNDAFDVLQKAVKNYPDNVQAKLLLARAALAKGDMAVAEESYRDAARMNPRNLEAINGRAQVALAKQDVALLNQLADSAIAIAPQYSAPYVWRGIAEQNRKETDKARADFLEALKLNPRDSNASLELGQLALIAKKIPEGKAYLEQTLSTNPGSVRALSLLNAIDVNDKHPEAAIARVQGLIARFPQRSDLYDQLAELQRYTKDLPGALTSAETAMKLNPSDTDAIVAYTRVQIASGNAPKAIATWQQWTKDHPKDAQADIVLGSLLETQGDRDKAIDSYKKALQIQPDQPIAANNLAYLMVEAGQNIDVALSLAQTARRGLPNSPSTADTLAWAYFHKESYLSARDLLEEALKTAPDDPALHYHLGLTYSKLSDKPNALLHLKKAVTLGPDTQIGKDAQTALTSLS